MVPGTTDLALGSALSKLAIVYPHSLGVAAELSQRILLQLIYFFAQFVSKSTGPSCEPSHCLAIDVGLPDPFLVTELRTTDLQSYRPRRPKTVHHRLNLN